MTGEQGAQQSTQRRPRRRPGENRERLIHAGIVEFGLLGYHGASTSVIAQRAEVPQPHVYASFGSKQDLFLACCRRAAELLLGTALAPEALPAEAAPRLLYQAVASLGDEQLRELIEQEIAPLRERMSRRELLGVISSGAAALLPHS